MTMAFIFIYNEKTHCANTTKKIEIYKFIDEAYQRVYTGGFKDARLIINSGLTFIIYYMLSSMYVIVTAS